VGKALRQKSAFAAEGPFGENRTFQRIFYSYLSGMYIKRSKASIFEEKGVRR
jgi:hypothetical protein